MGALKHVGTSGQITLGKKYAGRVVQMIEDGDKGVITLVFGNFTPDRETWLHKEPVRSKLDKALKYAATHPAKETSLKDFK